MQSLLSRRGSIGFSTVSSVSRPQLSRVTRTRSQAVESTADGSETASRRVLLLGAATAVCVGQSNGQHALASEEEYVPFFGFATPPTSYGGYGGNAKEAPKYTFEYPSGWKPEIPSKVEKGTQGVDGRVVNPRVKGQKAVVITLGRAGEDGKSFRLTDLDSTFQGFAGADYDLQDAFSGASEITKTQKDVDGYTFFSYDIDSPEVRYLSSIVVRDGKVFALFVKSPTKNFNSSEEKLRHMIDTFRLL
ncbi:thylakoid lumen protein [Haematococcus lacustris]